MAEPDVTVVVPVWGAYAGASLTQALDSLRSQDLPARIIVVDNASEPPLSQADLHGVELVRAPDRLSVGAARNLGLRSVRSPYVLFWDADDLMLPGTLRFLRDRIASDPDAVLVAAGIVEGDPPVPHRWPRRWASRLVPHRALLAFVDSVWSVFPTTGAVLMRANALPNEAYADANSGEDWVLGVSLAFRGRIVLEQQPGRLYRQHATSLWATQRSARPLVRHARAVRRRIRSDPLAPPWLRRSLPLIALMQLAAIFLVHPLAQTGRVIRGIRRSEK